MNFVFFRKILLTFRFNRNGLKFTTSVSMPRCFYAVRRGREAGVYETWKECETQVKGFPNCAYKKFLTEGEAWNFVRGESIGKPSYSNSNCCPSFSLTNSTNYASTNVSNMLSNVPKYNPSSYPSDTGRKPSFYAVHRGRKPGVYRTWTECEAQIKDYRNPSYRKLPTEEEAIHFVQTGGITKVGRHEAKRIKLNENFTDLSNDKEVPVTIDDLKQNHQDTVTVFTDGASAHNGKVNAAAGIGVYWGPNHPLNTSMRLSGRQTNNRAEIYAATHALRQAKQIGARNVKLYTDSQFLIHGITDWINKWKKNNWVLSSGQPVKNKDDFIELDKARQGLNVSWIYVKAHDNNPGNDEADRLAVAGARKMLESTEIILV